MIGIYKLINKGQVVYVGQSVQVETRIATHKREKIKEFDDIEIIKCSKENLNSTEAFYIHFHNPKYNKQKYEININNITKIKRKVNKNIMEMYTMIKILEETRDLAKRKAKARGMTLYGYIKMLVEKDLNNNK